MELPSRLHAVRTALDRKEGKTCRLSRCKLLRLHCGRGFESYLRSHSFVSIKNGELGATPTVRSLVREFLLD